MTRATKPRPYLRPLASIDGQRPCTEMRRAIRRRDDCLKTAKGIVTGILIGAGLWAAVYFSLHTLANWGMGV